MKEENLAGMENEGSAEREDPVRPVTRKLRRLEGFNNDGLQEEVVDGSVHDEEGCRRST